MSPTFTMLVGLPGSGKSVKAKEIAKKTGATIFSSDELREEMFGDVNHQNDNTKLFEELHKRIKDCLREGNSAIYDATNINYKRRMSFLAELKKITCEKVCIVVATPYEVCLNRNANRDRKVPEHVIERMYRQFNVPYWYEGWDLIQIEYGSNFCGCYGTAFDFCEQYHEYDQKNSHHELTLGDHCYSVGYQLQLAKNSELMIAGLLHDCGKPFCATNVNKKGEVTEDIHYYDHQYCGAYNSLFYKYRRGEDPLYVSILIHWHMQPYFNKEEKTKEKYRRLWGESLYEDIMELHRADEAAH